MIESLSIEAFMEVSVTAPILDVRTPAEFERGRIPGAINLPLFTDEERAIVGTAYKKQSREQAMLLGLDIVGGKMRSIVEAAQQAASEAGTKTLRVHCWRGGMRSGSVAWLLDLFGFKVYTLKGGYKFFRRFVLASFAEPRSVMILGGKTGSRKTHILHALRERGEQVIDLEGLAHHKGSAFGALGEPPQPTQEQFENELAVQWRKLEPTRRVWLEDESRMIGRSALPLMLWEQMRFAPTVFLDVPIEQRIRNTIEDYGAFRAEDLRASVLNIERRLGGLATRQALEALDADDRETTVRIALQYYDKAYLHGLNERAPATVRLVATSLSDAAQNAALLLQTVG